MGPGIYAGTLTRCHCHDRGTTIRRLAEGWTCHILGSPGRDVGVTHGTWNDDGCPRHTGWPY